MRVLSPSPPLWFLIPWAMVFAVGWGSVWRRSWARRGTRLASQAETVRFETPAQVKVRVIPRVFPRYWNPVMGPMGVTVSESIIRVAAPHDVGVLLGNDWPFVAAECEVWLEPRIGAFERAPAIVLVGPCGGLKVELAIRPVAELEDTIEAMVRAGASRTDGSPGTGRGDQRSTRGVDMRRLPPVALWVLIVAFLGTPAYFATHHNQVFYGRLSQHGLPGTAKVTSTDPNNHNTICYSYVLASRQYLTCGTSEDYQADQLSVGQLIGIVYDTRDPAVSCTCHNPGELVSTEREFAAFIGVGIVGFATLGAVGAARAGRRP